MYEIASLSKVVRHDVQTEVKVPAQNGRKAYSYFRNASAVKKGAAGVGAALAIGGLTAAAIALRKKSEESNALPAPVGVLTPIVAPQSTASRAGEFAKKAAIKAGRVAGGAVLNAAGAVVIGQVSGRVIKEAVKDRRSPEQKAAAWKQKEEEEREGREARYAAFLQSDPRATAKDNIEYQEGMAQRVVERVRGEELAPLIEQDVSKYLKEVEVAEKDLLSKMSRPDRLPPPKPRLEVGGALAPVNQPQTTTPPIPDRLPYNPRAPKVSTSGLTFAASEPSAQPQKPKFVQVAGQAGAALGRLYRQSKERDRMARENLANNTVDLNKVAEGVGRGARSVLSAVEGFARKAKQRVSEDIQTIDIKAEEVKESKASEDLKGVQTNALPEGGKRKPGRPKTKFTPKDFISPDSKRARNNSIYMRIDSFVDRLRKDTQIEVKVPAQNGRKAYSYFREGNEGEVGSPRIPSRKIVAGVGGAIAAAGLAGLAAIALRNRSEAMKTVAPDAKPKKAIDIKKDIVIPSVIGASKIVLTAELVKGLNGVVSKVRGVKPSVKEESKTVPDLKAPKPDPSGKETITPEESAKVDPVVEVPSLPAEPEESKVVAPKRGRKPRAVKQAS
jgi:hypothetical protein